MDDHERLEGWIDYLFHAYVHIAKVLGSLELPVLLPMNILDEDFMRTAVGELDRIEDTLIGDLPMPDLVRGMLRQSILDWLAALDMGALQLGEPSEYRERVFAHLIGRVLAQCVVALQALDDQGDPLNE